jgi:CRP/FNR family cyclic AMP-dependent transcriptional regulator
MASYEQEIKSAGEKKQNLLSRIDFSMMKYLWLANPLSGARKDSIPRFLRNVELLKNFSDNELRVLSKYMHSRKFAEGEIIFRQGEIGIGFYFIYSGQVDLHYNEESVENNGEKFLTLEEYSYLGELALLQENHPRAASAIARNKCELVGIFKPDLDHLIEHHPRLAAKLIQSISISIAERLYHLVNESAKMQRKLKTLEEANAHKE